MTTFIFATNNQNKVDEIRAILSSQFQIITLKEAGIDIDIPEPYDTLEANASEKSKVIHQLTNQNCFSEDTGLEIVALNGEPGVKSARYAGDSRDFDANLKKVLTKLEGENNRKAQFRTVISLILNGKEHLFEGVCSGAITKQQIGNKGFGYDPIFIPDGSNQTFAEMAITEKNVFSHRKKAFEQMISYLQNFQYQS